MTPPDPPPITYRNIAPDDAQALEDLELTVFASIDPADLYNTDELRLLAEVFPEGNFVALEGDTPVGMGLGILVEFDFDQPDHTLRDITGDDGVATHHRDHPWYYGTDISVLEPYRGRGIGKAMYSRRKEFVRRHNKRGIVAGGVIPGYADHLHSMPAAEYVEKVSAGKLHDATLSFQLSLGFRCPGVIADYVRDETVGNWASLIVWDNPDYRNASSPAAVPLRRTR